VVDEKLDTKVKDEAKPNEDGDEEGKEEGKEEEGKEGDSGEGDEEEAEAELEEAAADNDEPVFGNKIEIGSNIFLTQKHQYCLVKSKIDEDMYECIVKIPGKNG